jgi:hypothetical protein
MAQRCRVCSHAKLAEIEARLRKDESVADLSREYGMTRFALYRHRDGHLKLKTEGAVKKKTEGEVKKITYRPGDVPPRKLWRSPVRRAGNPQQRFLDAYVEFGNVKAAADVACVPQKQVYRWQEHDEQFVFKMREAEQKALAILEAEARERATKGAKLVREVWRGDRLIEKVIEWRPSDTLLIKLLQAIAPEKYGDKLAVTQTQLVKAIEQSVWETV